MGNVLVNETSLENIADAIRTKEGEDAGGTMTPAQMATRIANLPSGGGTTRPTTWAEFAAMTTTNMQKCYGVGDRVGIACPWKSPNNNVQYPDLVWEIAGWGTTKLENDETDYPCVTLVARLGTQGSYQFDAPETPLVATEETAQDGIYYFGYDGTNYTLLSLNTGDTIPYADYTAVYKSDVANNVTNFNNIRQYGLNIYRYSAVRQWLNSDATAGSWWESQHLGDVAPNYAAAQAGFMKDLDSSFKAILQKTEVVTAGNNTTDDGSTYTTYDYLFLPSNYELWASSSPVEGDRMGYFAIDGSGKNSFRSRGAISGGSSNNWWTRSAYRGYANAEYYITSNGASSISSASGTCLLVAACKIILAS